MTDLIEIKKENGRVIVVSRILENKKNEEVLEYIKGRISSTMNYQQYGFDKPIWGIAGKGYILPLDNSDKFFGRGDNGLVMICPNYEEIKSSGEDLYILYDDEDSSEELINF